MSPFTGSMFIEFCDFLDQFLALSISPDCSKEICFRNLPLLPKHRIRKVRALLSKVYARLPSHFLRSCITTGHVFTTKKRVALHLNKTTVNKCKQWRVKSVRKLETLDDKNDNVNLAAVVDKTQTNYRGQFKFVCVYEFIYINGESYKNKRTQIAKRRLSPTFLFH